jgi:hypothetical protein
MQDDKSTAKILQDAADAPEYLESTVAAAGTVAKYSSPNGPLLRDWFGLLRRAGVIRPAFFSVPHRRAEIGTSISDPTHFG